MNENVCNRYIKGDENPFSYYFSFQSVTFISHCRQKRTSSSILHNTHFVNERENKCELSKMEEKKEKVSNKNINKLR
jgi:hypothetical protein